MGLLILHLPSLAVNTRSALLGLPFQKSKVILTEYSHSSFHYFGEVTNGILVRILNRFAPWSKIVAVLWISYGNIQTTLYLLPRGELPQAWYEDTLLTGFNFSSAVALATLWDYKMALEVARWGWGLTMIQLNSLRTALPSVWGISVLLWSTRFVLG
jgi:hypothetical protein